MVPFIIYGKDLNKSLLKTNISGSHKDISATLLDIIEPTNFSYYSFGNSLFKKPKEKIGFGFNKIITKTILKEYSKNYGTRSFKINNIST